jgi:hypothetical protein
MATAPAVIAPIATPETNLEFKIDTSEAGIAERTFGNWQKSSPAEQLIGGGAMIGGLLAGPILVLWVSIANAKTTTAGLGEGIVLILFGLVTLVLFLSAGLLTTSRNPFWRLLGYLLAAPMLPIVLVVFVVMVPGLILGVLVGGCLLLTNKFTGQEKD